MIRFDHYPQFITITNLNWLPILQNDHHKQIILEALKTRIQKKQLTLYAFLLMPNHMHFIWQLHDGIIREGFQKDFLKFTARSLLQFMRMNDDPLLPTLRVKAPDRKFQIWERNSLSIDLSYESIFAQKMKYLHDNPTQPKWGLSVHPEEYLYSSAIFYETGLDRFGILTHYRG